MQIYSDLVTDVELSIRRLGWHGRSIQRTIPKPSERLNCLATVLLMAASLQRNLRITRGGAMEKNRVKVVRLGTVGAHCRRSYLGPNTGQTPDLCPRTSVGAEGGGVRGAAGQRKMCGYPRFEAIQCVRRN